MNAPLIIFFVLAAMAVIGAISLIIQRHPIHSALSLIVVMIALAGLYLLMGAEFVAAVQIIVYGGAIMVLFVFVIMLLNLGHPSELAHPRGKWWKFAAGVVGLGLLSEIMVIATAKLPQQLIVPRDFNEQQLQKLNAVGTIAEPLFRDYPLAFELTSVLLLVAIAGAVVLARGRAAGAR